MAHRSKPNLLVPSRGAFGEVITGELTPQAQLAFGSVLPPELGTLTAVGASASAAVDASERQLKLSTGAATNHQAIFESVQPASYHAGQGALVRFTALFTTGVANSSQFVGVGDNSDGFFIGFQGTNFGVLRRTSGNPEVRTLSITTGADADGGTFTITLGDDGTKVITVGANDTLSEIARIIVEEDFTNVGTGWKAFHSDIDKGGSPQNSATVYFVAIAAEAKTGSFTVTDTGSSGVAGAIAAADVTGVAPTETFVVQADFNFDSLDGTGPVSSVIDFTKGNVYEIRYQWLGYGKIDFFIEDPDTGEFVLMHAIKYANSATTPSIAHPTLPLRAEVTNTSNNSDMIIRAGSIAGFTEGTKDTPSVTYHGVENSITLTDGTETPLLAIKNDLVFAGAINRNRIRFISVFVALRSQTGGQTDVVVFRARANCFLTSNHGAAATTTDFVSSDTTKGLNFTSSVARVDFTSDGIDISSLVKAGILQLSITLAGEGASDLFDLVNTVKDAFLAPSNYFVITAERISGSGNLDVDVSLNWQDIF